MAEEQEVKVEPYKRIAFREAWRGRSRAFWSIAAIGLAAGAMIGLAAPFIPLVAGLFISSIGSAATLQGAISVIPASVAIFAASGMATGAVVGGILGGPAAAEGAIAEEMEKREFKREKAFGKALGIDVSQPVVEVKSKRPNTRYFNPKVMALFAGFGAIGGAVLVASLVASGGATAVAGAAVAPGLSVVLGETLAANTAAVGAYIVGVMTCFGALFGFNAPKMATDLQDFTGKLLSGEKLHTSWEKKKKVSVDVQPEMKVEIQHLDIENEQVTKTNHAAKFGNRTQITSFGEMVLKSAEKSQLSVPLHLL